MGRLLLGLLIIASGIGAKAQNYSVIEISEAMEEDALAVVREHDASYELLSKSEAVYREHKVITIYKEDADVLAKVNVVYNKLSKVTELKAYAYDKYGVEIAKLKKSEISDESLISDFSLYSDTRLKTADISQNTYPYTVEYFIEKEFNFVYSIPDFMPQMFSPVSVENASYELKAPIDLMPRYKEIAFTGTKNVTTEGSIQKIQWKLENLPTLEMESFGLSIEDRVPHVLLAPSLFEYDGYVGDMSTWDDYMKWMSKLQENSNTLSPDVIAKLDVMTQGMTKLEKIKTIYQYMQGKTRYVSIQDGIGGLQPFESGLVDEIGYGDCKALSFYTKSMLESVGISSNYALIYGGSSNKRKFYPDFPHHFANHAILMVPMETDTVWLECTSQTKPFGFLGDFTDDRDAVLITDDGAALVKTPRYDHTTNTQFRTANVVVDENGTADAQVSTTYRGLQYENGDLDRIIHYGRDKQKKWVYNSIRIASYELEKFSIENRPDIIPEAEVSIQLHINKLTSMSGKRVFLTPNLMNKFENFLPKLEERTEPVFIRMGYFDIDTVIYKFPSNLRAEYIPEGSTIESEYGYYETSYEFIQGELVYIRKFKFYEGTYEPEEYGELFDFLSQVEKEDKQRMVLLLGT